MVPDRPSCSAGRVAGAIVAAALRRALEPSVRPLRRCGEPRRRRRILRYLLISHVRRQISSGPLKAALGSTRSRSRFRLAVPRGPRKRKQRPTKTRAARAPHSVRAAPCVVLAQFVGRAGLSGTAVREVALAITSTLPGGLESWCSLLGSTIAPFLRRASTLTS